MLTMIVAREIYWQTPRWLNAIHYGLFAIAAVVFVFGILKRYYRWKLGKPENRLGDYVTRIWRVIYYGFFQRRILTDIFSILIHPLIFYGFLLLFVGTMIVLVQADFGLVILTGHFYEYFSVVLDIGGLALLTGLLLALARRFVIGSRFKLEKTMPDAFAVFLLLASGFLGFLMEGIRISVTELPEKSDMLIWSPVGTVFAYAINWMGVSIEGLKHSYPIWWFIHSTVAIIFIAYIPYSKLWHIFMGPANIFFSSLEHPGVLSTPDLEKSESFGVGTIKDFTWKHLIDLDSCMRCGRCRAGCPTDLSEKPLSPRQLIVDLRTHFESINPKDKNQEFKTLCGNVITDDTIWACTTCKYCQSHCPVFIEHVDKIIELRRHLVLSESRFPNELKSAFKNMETNGNPWPLSWDQRGKWAEGSNVKVLSENSPKTDYLLWIGCAGSTDERNTKVAMALVRVLQKAGIDFVILGNQERCCGEPARRLGNDYLYQMLVQENMENFKQYQFKQIITYCPHCYNSFKNEYPVFPQSGDANTKWKPVPVLHHTQLIKQLINEGKLKIDGKLDKIVTYHDSCYLGRYNQIYEEPRTILKNIKSVQLKEMKRNKLESFCCGAGGGRMWLEEKIGKRINQIRTEEARETGADIIATACPYCLTMLGDGIKEKGLAETMKAKDIAEIVDETMIAQA